MENLEANPSKLDFSNKLKEGTIRFLYEEQSNELIKKKHTRSCNIKL